MPDFRFTHWGFARRHTFKEVAHVTVARGQPDRSRGKWCREELWIAGLDLSARDPDPAVFSFKFDSALLSLRVQDRTVPRIGICTVTSLFPSVVHIADSNDAAIACCISGVTPSHSSTANQCYGRPVVRNVVGRGLSHVVQIPAG